MRRALALLWIASCTPEAPASTAATASAPSAAPLAASAPAAPAASCSTPCAEGVERCEGASCVPACPSGEVYVPATGSEGFTMGGDIHEGSDPPHQVVLTRPFCMDATEVTVKSYAECVAAGACDEPRTWGMWINYPKLADHPINKVDWREALTYCRWRGKSLPTEAQWEWAATGGDGRRYAWGDEPPTCDHADFTPGVLEGPSSDDGCWGGGTSAVASFPKGDRVWPAGRIHDLSGNVWEWTLDNYRPLSAERQVDPLYLSDEGGYHVTRGGGWNRSAAGIRVHYRGGSPVDYKVPALGFRCVRNVNGSKAPPG